MSNYVLYGGYKNIKNVMCPLARFSTEQKGREYIKNAILPIWRSLLNDKQYKTGSLLENYTMAYLNEEESPVRMLPVDPEL